MLTTHYYLIKIFPLIEKPLTSLMEARIYERQVSLLPNLHARQACASELV
jgi:hypothetical protein